MSLNPPKANIINTESFNDLVPSTITNIAHWHHKRNLVDGTTDEKQFEKLMEEFIELWCAMHPNREPIVVSGDMTSMVHRLYHKARIKMGKERIPEMKDALGDMSVVMINIMERNGFTFEECIIAAYNEIKDRRGRMIDGTFVKEEDLPENQKEI